MAPSELLLTITMTNVSDRVLGVGCGFGPPIWATFGIDVHDGEKVAVPETPFGHRMHNAHWEGSCPGLFLQPGKAINTEVILNRVYDLARPGKYTVQLQRADPNTGMIVKSNVVTFRVPWDTLPGLLSAPAFKIAAAAPQGSVKAGWNVPIEIAVTNVSEHTIRLAVWQGRSRTDHWLAEAQQLGSGVEVRDSQGAPVPLTKVGRALRTGDDVPEGSFIYVPVRPGEVWKETRVIGTISDIRTAGRYTATVVLMDPSSGLVRSNAIPFVVTNADQPEGEHSEAAPPFIVTIRSTSAEDPFSSRNDLPVQVCMTNISDREIKLDNTITRDYIEVWDSSGVPVPLTENGRVIRGGFGQGSVSNEHPIAPGESMCGGINLRTLYAFSSTGDYTVQVGRAWEPNTSPEPKPNLPLVKSNVVTVSMAP